MSAKTKQELLQSFMDSLDVIDHNIKGFNAGVIGTYKAIAGQLRILLCDKPSLIARVVPDPVFHKWYWDLSKDQRPQFTYPTFQGSWIDHESADFDFSVPGMPLEDWLEQVIAIEVLRKTTIRDLIRSVADKDGGAHVDPTWNATLMTSRSVKSSEGVRSGMGAGFHQPFIGAIGAYISFECRELVKAAGNSLGSTGTLRPPPGKTRLSLTLMQMIIAE